MSKQTKPPTFRQFCTDHGIELRPWQDRAATALLREIYPQRAGATGKTLLINHLRGYLDLYGNRFEIE